MRVAMVGPFGFHPKKTMRARAFRLARALVRQGHVVSLFMPPWHTPEQSGRIWEEEGVALVYTSLQGGIPGTTWRLVEAVEAYRPEVVHVFKPKAYSGLTGWWFWQRRRKRVRLVVDTDDWEGPGGWNDVEPYHPLQKRFFAWQERWGMRHCHYLTVASRALESLAWAHGVAPERVVYLPNGPGIELRMPDAHAGRVELGLVERPVLLLYSRLFEFDTARLVNVLASVRDQIPDLAILTVGAGLFAEDATVLRSQLAQQRLLDHVVDAGWVAEDALPEVLQAADVGLYLMDDTLLNRTKCPVKLADMLGAGVPVVAEAVGQVSEYVVPDRTGLLRETGDVAGLSADVVALLRAPERRGQLAVGARAHIRKHFAWERLAHRLLPVYASEV